MNESRSNDRLFIIFMLCVVILAAVYLTVPERKEFWGFQLQWWKEFMSMLQTFLSG